ncbi:hypothetical protein KJ865_14175, partial [Myxococcota bacterium]|nr:hypothetical protein [Myxococcota bacterium]
EHALETPLVCPQCGGRYLISDLLNAPLRYWPGPDAVIAQAPCCGAREELRIESGAVCRGYTYAAARMHFCAMERYIAPDLEIIQKDKMLAFSFQGRHYLVSEKGPENDPQSGL